MNIYDDHRIAVSSGIERRLICLLFMLCLPADVMTVVTMKDLYEPVCVVACTFKFGVTVWPKHTCLGSMTSKALHKI